VTFTLTHHIRTGDGVSSVMASARAPASALDRERQ
jgi:hypothetical protein